MNSILKKSLSFIMVFCMMFLTFAFTVNVSAAEESVELANGSHDGSSIIWTAANDKITITQTKGSSSTAVNSSYVAAPRVYKGHILSFVASDGYTINSIEITYTGKYLGNSITAGNVISDGTTVTDDTSIVTKTLGTSTSGGTHVFTATTGQTAIYIQNVASASNVQLRPTAIKVSYSLPVGVEPLSAPTSVEFVDNIVAWDAVEGAVSYEVGLFDSIEGLEPVETVFTTTDTIYEINYTPQGTYYVKVRAIGDGTNHSNSEWSDAAATALINNQVQVLTIAEFLELEIEQTTNKTYYQVTGVITDITSNYFGSIRLTIQDPTDGSEVQVYHLDKEGATSWSDFGIDLGYEITIKGFRGDYNGTQQIQECILLDSYFDQATVTLANFTALEVKASLNFAYNTLIGAVQESVYKSLDFNDAATRESEGTEKVSSYTSTWSAKSGSDTYTIYGANNNSWKNNWTYIKFGNKSDASVGYIITPQIDEAVSKVTMNITAITTSKVNSIYLGVYSDPECTTAIVENIAASVIEVGEVTFAIPTANQGANYYYKIFIDCLKGSSNGIVTVDKVDFYASVASVDYSLGQTSEGKNEVALRFQASISEELFNELAALGTNVTYGIVAAKASALGSQTLEEAIAASDANVIDIAATNMALVDDEGNVVTEGATSRQFALLLNGIPTEELGTEIVATAYVCIDGTYYYMSTAKQFSVQSLAAVYVADYAADADVAGHLGALAWLSTYTEAE